MIIRDFRQGQQITIEFVSISNDSLMLRLPNGLLAWVAAGDIKPART